MSNTVIFDSSTSHCRNKILILENRGKIGQYTLKAIRKGDVHKLPKEAITKIDRISKILNRSTTSISASENSLHSVHNRIHRATEKHNNKFIRTIFKAILPKFIFDLLRFPCLVEYKRVEVAGLVNKNAAVRNPVQTSASVALHSKHVPKQLEKVIKEMITNAYPVKKHLPIISPQLPSKKIQPLVEVPILKGKIPLPATKIKVQEIKELTNKIIPLKETSDEISGQVWKALIQPLTQDQIFPKTLNASTITSSIDESGCLAVRLDVRSLGAQAVKELKDRLEINHRIASLKKTDNALTFTIPNHHLLHLMLDKPSLLDSIYQKHPEIKEMHDILLKGKKIEKLLSESSEANKFLSDGLPGDYIIVKNSHAKTLFYKAPDGEVKAFSFSEHYKSFSSYQGLEYLKRPFLFRDRSPQEVTKMHNAFLHFKNIGIINRLVEYSRSGIRSPVLGSVDGLLDIEDLIAWYEHLPDGKKKKELFQPICTFFSETFGHFNSLKGHAYSKEHKIRLEGMHSPMAKSQLSEAVLRYLPKTNLLTQDHRRKLYQMSRNSVKYSNKSMHVISNRTGLHGDAEKRFNKINQQISTDLNQGIPVSITTGWTGHAVEITLLSRHGVSYLMYTNRGASLDTDLNTKLYRISKPITAQMIGHLRRPPPMEIDSPSGPKNKGAYFYAPQNILNALNTKYSGNRPKTMIEEFALKSIGKIKKSKQKVGNCAVANGKGMFQNSVLLLKFTELLSKGYSEEQALKLAEKHAYKVHKEFQQSERGYQMGVWKRFSKSFSDEEIKYAKKHFEFFQMITRKVIGNKNKYDKYQGMEAVKGTQVAESIEELKTTMQGFVRECPYDIEACAADLPFKTGNTIKKGPNGCFSLYKGASNKSTMEKSPIYHLGLKNDSGMFEVFKIYETPSATGCRYQIQIKNGNFDSFTTLGELAKIVEQKGHQMVFAL